LVITDVFVGRRVIKGISMHVYFIVLVYVQFDIHTYSCHSTIAAGDSVRGLQTLERLAEFSTLLYAQKYLHEMQGRDADGHQKVPSLVIVVTFDAQPGQLGIVDSVVR